LEVGGTGAGGEANGEGLFHCLVDCLVWCVVAMVTGEDGILPCLCDGYFGEEWDGVVAADSTPMIICLLCYTLRNPWARISVTCYTVSLFGVFCPEAIKWSDKV